MGLLSALFSGPAAAQDPGGRRPVEATEAAESPPSEAEPSAPARKNLSASGYATTDEPFRPRRGFSAEGELGVFLTFGGRNANETSAASGFASRPVSNANPYVAVILGYDVVTTNTFALSIGPKFGAGFNGGSSRLTPEDVEVTGVSGASTFANDYALYEAGINLSLTFMASERLAIAGKLNGGAVFIDANPTVDYCGANGDSDGPSPTLPAEPSQAELDTFRDACGNTDAGDLAIGGLFGASLGIEWYTLLNGFSVGLQVRFQGVMVDRFIPGLAIPATLRYTF